MKYVYIAGPMGGRENWNFPLFNEVERDLIERGWGVYNPAVQGAGDKQTCGTPGDYKKFLPQDVAWIAASDYVVVLHGWERSKGAVFEVLFAKLSGIPVHQAVYRLPTGKWDIGNEVVLDLSLLGEHMNYLGFYGIQLYEHKEHR